MDLATIVIKLVFSVDFVSSGANFIQHDYRILAKFSGRKNKSAKPERKPAFRSKGHSPTTTCIASCEYKAVDVEICVRLPGENLRCSIDMVSTGKECKEQKPDEPKPDEPKPDKPDDGGNGNGGSGGDSLDRKSVV